MPTGVDITKIVDSSGVDHKINAALTNGIPFGQVDSTSTATKFTATVPGITELKDGVCVMLKNGVVTSAAGFTININGLGAKNCYTNMAAATADTTIFNVSYTMLFVYDSTRDADGGWICYRGYDANTNTIGYQLRTNSSTLNASDTGYRYRLWFTSADGSQWVPANTSTSTDSTTSRSPNTTPINPFGPIVYNSTNGTVQDGAALPKATLWQQYAVTIGYSFNEPNGAMTFPAPVYLKCTPQTNGSAVMVELVQTLPSTNDGYIYILLGRAYSATAMELIVDHPVFYHDGTAIRLWTGAASSGDGVTSFNGQTGDVTYTAPVTSVNGQTGAVTVTEGPAPLIGSTADTTPTQVLAALQAGRTVYISYTDANVGLIVASYFNVSAAFDKVVSSFLGYLQGALISVSLEGDITNGTWAANVTYLQTLLDPIVQFLSVNGAQIFPDQSGFYNILVPTKVSDLNNDSGFLTLGTLPIYDGSVV